MAGGSFHALAAATLKTRSPNFRRVLETCDVFLFNALVKELGKLVSLIDMRILHKTITVSITIHGA